MPVRLKEVVYTISPFETTVLTGLFKDVPGKMHKYWKEVSACNGAPGCSTCAHHGFLSSQELFCRCLTREHTEHVPCFCRAQKWLDIGVFLSCRPTPLSGALHSYQDPLHCGIALPIAHVQ